MSGFPQLPPEVLAALAKENQSPKVIALIATFTGISFFFVVLRFFTRIKFIEMVGIEDYFIGISVLFAAATSACLIEGAKYGIGRHMITLPMENLPLLLKYLFFSILTYHVSLTATKLSILLQYRRIFTLKEARMRIYAAMALCLVCGTIAIVCAIFTCVPVSAYWHYERRPFAKCVNQDAMYHANAGLNIATDLLVAVLPIKAIWRLQIARRQKIALLSILTLGWFVVIVSIIRLVILVKVAKHPEDQTWFSGPTAYWSAIEVHTAIVCATTPTLKPLIVAIVPGFASRLGSKPSRNTDGTVNSNDSTIQRRFMRLQGKSSQSTMEDDIDLEVNANGLVTAVPNAHKKTGQIHVTRDIEQRSANVFDGSFSESDSQKNFFGSLPARADRR
ncbi:hypothetical protein EJ04DRAFT_491971 [Polyplosphaeria fusca]|uniref:Rhodopsin domain-containing protein n=1 Tax=Polyplosphaeria fusca TaxID=682080 RepID=A0A9P4R187_9PLEO|nr:hypothetical protein EJ04DRAFT_491971 [Polyplosphaeria fusca]